MRQDDSDHDDFESGGAWNVYFLTLVDPRAPNVDLKFVKVGITKGAVEARIANLQTGNPYQIQSKGSFQSTVAHAIECWVHRTRHVERLEWLRLSRSDIDALRAEAMQENERLTRIAEAKQRWSQIESNGKERSPSADDRRIHDNYRCVLEAWIPADLELQRIRMSIALASGKVKRVPGVVQVSTHPPCEYFKDRLARERFKDIADGYMVERIKPFFKWRKAPDKGWPQWAGLRAEVERLKQERANLNAAILSEANMLRSEGERTPELEDLHERYISLSQKEFQLKVDKADLKSQAIQSMEEWEGICGLWSFKRQRKQEFDAGAFRDEHRAEALACRELQPAYIKRRIFESRSY